MANTFDLPTEGCTDRIVAPETPCATHNLVVWNVDSRVRRIIEELTRNVSSRIVGFTPDDKERIDAMFAELLRFINQSTTDILDLHYLAEFKLTDISLIAVTVENETVNSALAYLIGANINLRMSQSTRMNDSLLEFDKKDLIDAINKAKRLIDGFWENDNPMDLPQSNPSQPVQDPTSV